MTTMKNLIIIGITAAFAIACGSKEKDGDVVAAPVEDVASEDVEHADTAGAKIAPGEGTEEAGSVAPTPEERKAKRDEMRRSRLAEGGGNMRDRRAERLAKITDEGGEGADFDPTAMGPRTVKPGGNFANPKMRPPPVPLDESGEVVAVAPDQAVNDAGPEGDQPLEITAGPAAEAPTAEQPLRDVAPLAARGADPMADRILPLASVSEILGKGNLRAQGVLPGIAAVDGYSSAYYDLSSKDYGVALQAWRDLTPRETEDRFRRVRLQHPNADDIQSLKPLKAFYAGYFGIQSITFARPDKLLVVTLSCGKELCSHADLLKLAQAAQSRL